MKVKRMGITEILKRIWLFSANRVKNNFESVSKQPNRLIVELSSSLWHIIVNLVIDDGDLVVGQVEHDQGLDLIELGVRYGTDTVTVQVQVFQSALNL